MATYRLWFLLAFGLFTAGSVAAPVGTGFTYQGELKVSGVAANSAHDFEFALFNVDTAGSAISTLTRGDLMLNAGLFTVELDYTDVPFVAAEQYWLEVRVRDGASTGGYTQLLPRQKITPAPYAVNAHTVQAGPANNVGFYTPLAIGSDGLPVISYYDITAGALKVAKCGTQSCQ